MRDREYCTALALHCMYLDPEIHVQYIILLNRLAILGALETTAMMEGSLFQLTRLWSLIRTMCGNDLYTYYCLGMMQSHHIVYNNI